MANNAFLGKNGLRDYLNPHNQVTPLIELPPELNPFYDDGVRVHLKMMSQTPLANVKSLPAWSMLEEAKKEGLLDKVDTLIENSSGNTVYSLGILGKLFGVSITKAVASHQVSKGKLALLRFFGVQPMINEEPICPDPSDPTSGIYKAKKWASEQQNLFNPGQYDNFNNPNIHGKITGPQIWNQTEGKVQIFCAGLGTTGTMVGTGTFLKTQKNTLHAVGVVRSKNNPVPGPRTQNLLGEIAFDWEGVCDQVVEVGTVESYTRSLELCRHGLLVGPSTGFAFCGLCKAINAMKKDGRLERLKNEEGLVHAVTIACDTPFPYFEEYFKYLDEAMFPQIENEELLMRADDPTRLIPEEDMEVDVNVFIKLAYGLSREELLQRDVNAIVAKEDVVILDVRPKQMYNHFHIPSASWTDPEEPIADDLKGKTVFVVCQRGVSSVRYAIELRESGVDAYSLDGGTIEWSYQDLPRVRPEVCVRKH